MDIFFFLFGIALFIAVILLIEGLYVSWNSTRGPEAKRIARRLQMVTAGDTAARVSIRKQRMLSKTAAVQQLLQRLPHIGALDRLLQQADAKYDAASFVLRSLACGATVFGMSLLLPWSMLMAALCGLAATPLPLLMLMQKRRKRLARIEAQLPDALDLMGRALRAGHALPASLQMVADEVADPLGSEFRIVADEVNFGVSMQDALNSLASRVPGTDVGYFVVAVLIQRETGGNLTELLGNIASIVRERLKLYGQVRALSAEGRLSAWILSLLPFALAGLLNLINPHFMSILWTDPAGVKMISGALVLMLFGIVWMRNVIRIRV